MLFFFYSLHFSLLAWLRPSFAVYNKFSSALDSLRDFFRVAREHCPDGDDVGPKAHSQPRETLRPAQAATKPCFNGLKGIAFCDLIFFFMLFASIF
jgi:hypothetical protein